MTPVSQPVRFPWLKHYPACIPAELDYPQAPAWSLLERTAVEHGARIGAIYYKERRTFAELAEGARRTASALARSGVAPGDRVAIMLPNVPEYLTALNGIWMAGAVPVALSPLMVPDEVSAMLGATGARTLIGLDVLAPLFLRGEHAPQRVFLTTIADRLPAWQRIPYAFARWRKLGLWSAEGEPEQLDYAERLAAADPRFEPIQPDSLDAPAYILPTGGTTGKPKAVTLSHRNVVANAWQLFHWSGGRPARESLLAVLPYFHSYGLTTCLMTATAMAATSVLHHRFIPRVVLKLIEEHQPSIFPAVPAMLVALNELLRERPIEFRNLKCVISGGAPLPPAVAEEFAEHSGATVVEGFGLSEASPVTHSNPLDRSDRPGTIGIPLPDTDARIVDAETGARTLTAGEVGELIVRGPQVMLGYWNDEEATRHAIRDGWLFTGDLGTMDDDGFFRIVDRKKDLIITSGFNVYPSDVEHALREFPGVADVAVVGVPCAERGEKVAAMIAMKSGHQLDRRAFDAFCGERLAKHKQPRVVEVVDGDLPRNFLGKVLRRKLRDAETAATDVPAERLPGGQPKPPAPQLSPALSCSITDAP
ncbi:MAG: long-chain fatty acid--CoA ligase [Planctomycetaceae bacterium]